MNLKRWLNRWQHYWHFPDENCESYFSSWRTLCWRHTQNGDMGSHNVSSRMMKLILFYFRRIRIHFLFVSHFSPSFAILLAAISEESTLKWHRSARAKMEEMCPGENAISLLLVFFLPLCGSWILEKWRLGISPLFIFSMKHFICGSLHLLPFPFNHFKSSTRGFTWGTVTFNNRPSQVSVIFTTFRYSNTPTCILGRLNLIAHFTHFISSEYIPLSVIQSQVCK